MTTRSRLGDAYSSKYPDNGVHNTDTRLHCRMKDHRTEREEMSWDNILNGFYDNMNSSKPVSRNLKNKTNRQPQGGKACTRQALVPENIYSEKAQLGQDVTLTIKNHDDRSCKQFVVTSPRFSPLRWMIYTALLNAVGFLLELHLQDSRILVAILIFLCVALVLKFHLKVKQESLLVMASLGVQLSTTFASGRTVDHFYDISQIHDIVINEGITMHKVIFYLTLLVKEHTTSNSASRLVPIFTHSWPSLSCLKKVYCGAQQVLHHRSTSSHSAPR